MFFLNTNLFYPVKGDAYPHYDNKQGYGSEAPCLIAIIESCPPGILLWCAWVFFLNA